MSSFSDFDLHFVATLFKKRAIRAKNGHATGEDNIFSVLRRKVAEASAIYTHTGVDSRASDRTPVRLPPRSPSTVFQTSTARGKKCGRDRCTGSLRPGTHPIAMVLLRDSFPSKWLANVAPLKRTNKPAGQKGAQKMRLQNGVRVLGPLLDV